jgi:hypothetical protein
MDDKKQEAPKEKQQEHPPRDYYSRLKPDENGHISKDQSGSGWSGERWSGRSQSGGRER